MDKVLEKLADLNIGHMQDSHEIQILDARSWKTARKRLGRAYYVTLTEAVYEIYGTRVYLIAPQGVDVCR